MNGRQLTSITEDKPLPALHEDRREPRPTRVRAWLSTRHKLWTESIALVILYVVYDAGRGLAAGGRRNAVHHARSIAKVERHLHLSIERSVQHAATHVPGLIHLFGFGYAVFHLGITIAVLSWLWFCHPARFAQVRTALMVTTLLALVGFIVYPTAPPRLAGIGVHDTLSLGNATSHSEILRLLYNPYAAMPSVHIAFAVVAGGAVAAYSTHRSARVIGALYPFYVAAEVVATGNHFVLDVVAGAAIGVLSATIAARLVTRGPDVTQFLAVATVKEVSRTASRDHRRTIFIRHGRSGTRFGSCPEPR